MKKLFSLLSAFTPILILAIIMAVVFASCVAGDSGGTTAVETTVDTTAVVTTTPVEVTTTSPQTSAPPETTAAPSDEQLLAGDNFSIGNTSYVYSFTHEDAKRINDAIDRLEELLSASVDYPSFEALYETVYETEMNYAAEQNSIAYIYFCLLGKSERASENDLYIDSFFTSFTQRIYSMYEKIYNSPFSVLFFDGWTEDEVEYARSLAVSYTEEYTALSDENSRLLVEYRALSDSEFLSGSERIYLKMVRNNNAIAKLMGYDNYMTYAYSRVYGRDYSPEDTVGFSDYIKTYIVPLLAAVNGDVMTKITSMSQSQIGMISSFLYGKNEDVGLKTYFDSYAASIGGSFLDTYNSYLESKNYFYAHNDDISQDSAFTVYLYESQTPVMYFGPNYQSLLTFVHEFGHYYAAYMSEDGGSMNSYDLSETQSQGNEWLFLSRLNSMILQEIGDFIAEYSLFQNLASMITCAIVNDFEMYVYSHIDEIREGELDDIYIAICEKYGGYDMLCKLFGYQLEVYWHYVTLEYPAYYISYAVSQVPALELFITSRSDFAVAAEAYVKVAETKSIHFLEALGEASLLSPFEEQTFIMLYDGFNRLFGLDVAKPRE